MRITYDSEELIEELKHDINEFGDTYMYAFYEEICGKMFITNYDFILEEKPLTPKETQNSRIVIMKASEILKKLQKQQEI